MAGNYPNVPSYRMAWDRDGTAVVYFNNAGSLVQLTSAQMTALNDEGNVSPFLVETGIGTVRHLAFIFPEARDLDALFVAGVAAFTTSLSWNLAVLTSVDSTNGIDGTWVSLANLTPAQWIFSASNVAPTDVPVRARTNIVSATVLAVKAVRFTWTSLTNNTLSSFVAAHLFGEISPAQNPNRLALWHPTLDQRITPAYFDWGNVPRSSSADRTFRVKNLSTVQTANSVRVAQEILTDTTPSVVGQHTLSVDAVTFLAQVNVGALAPNAISGLVTLRRVTPSDAVMSVWSHRVFAEATTWS